MNTYDSSSEISGDEGDKVVAERRAFARLTALASWRSEYILRTRLLRAVGRGKPAEFESPGSFGSSRPGVAQTGNAQITYSSGLPTTVTHLHATFGSGINKRNPRFLHGAGEIGYASMSDPSNGKIDRWGLSDYRNFVQFAEIFPGDAQHGLGFGDVVGIPNCMDVSQPHGVVYGEGYPGGSVYYRSTDEQTGRYIAPSVLYSRPDLGIPRLDSLQECISSLWIAKSSALSTITGGLVGILSGSSYGIVTAYALGGDILTDHAHRYRKGEITARWVLSPGVPIIALAVDDEFSERSLALGRFWAVALNALGEVFYLKDIPARETVDEVSKNDPFTMEEAAWKAGRTVYWTLIEPTRRTAKPNPFDWSGVDGSYSPRSSWNGMGLSIERITAETKEIESFIVQKPKHFRSICQGWDMRRRLEVDFAGDDSSGAGEGIFVFKCGLDDGQTAEVVRYTRVNVVQLAADPLFIDNPETQMLAVPEVTNSTSIIGGVAPTNKEEPMWSFPPTHLKRRTSVEDLLTQPSTIEEWRTSKFSFGGLRAPRIMTTTADMSTFATVPVWEDPILKMNPSSAASSPLSSPLGRMNRPGSSADIPGQRARLIAAGTKTGTIFIWNMRAPSSIKGDLTNTVEPVRIIHTDSPQISCLALSALYLVHGGNDGLVQAWDPLASTLEPLKTLNSRFSSRARRRLVQAEASVQGVGVNLFAAGAICLDPDPTVIRGMVSLGTHLRYWSYSSSAADQYKGSKRKLRRSERGSNQNGEKFSGTGRSALKDYIASEKYELEKEKQSRRKEEERLAGRFGLGLLGPGASDEEMIAYATLLSKEAAQHDEMRRKSESDSDTATQVNHQPSSSRAVDDTELDPDIAKAITLSLQDETERAYSPEAAVYPMDFPLKYVRSRKSPTGSPRGTAGADASRASRAAETDDLDFALKLSLAEEESLKDVDFPALSRKDSPSPPGKGKRRK